MSAKWVTHVARLAAHTWIPATNGETFIIVYYDNQEDHEPMPVTTAVRKTEL